MRGGAGAMAAIAMAAILSVAGDAGTADAAPRGKGQWRIEARQSPIAGKTQYSAVIISRARNSSLPRHDPFALQLASLQLMCFDGAPIVRLHFSQRNGSRNHLQLSYRAAGQERRQPPFRLLSDLRTFIIDERAAVIQFANDMRAANMLWVELFALTTGMSVTDFRVEFADTALDIAYADCPLKTPAKTTGR
jgi:hypothetical protein